MRKSVPAKAAAIAALSLSVVMPAAAQEACKSMQVFLSISPQHRENVMGYIAPRLKEKFGVDLIAEAIGSGPMVERISAQMPNPRVSVAHFDVAVGISACDKGLCRPIDPEKIPNAKTLFDWASTRDKNGAIEILATNAIGVGLLYNEESFKKNKIPVPTSWSDLERPEVAGRISITAPASTWGTAELVQWAKMGGGSEGNVEPGFHYVKKLMPNMHTVHTWSSELSNLMQLGEVWLAATGSNMAPALRAQGLPVRWVMPKEGGPFVSGGASLIKGAPCEEAGNEYVNLYFSAEFQALRMKDGGVASPQPAAWDKLPAAERAGMDLNIDLFPKLRNFDWRAINVNRAAWIERWQREIR